VSRIRTYRNVVDSLQGGAIGTLTESGASTTRFKVGMYLHTFPSGLPTAVDGAGQPVLRANPGGSLISLPGLVGRADLGARDTCTVASGKAVVTSKVATGRAGTRAQGERVGRVAAGSGSGGDLGLRKRRCLNPVNVNGHVLLIDIPDRSRGRRCC
jgi:hypothetical protein